MRFNLSDIANVAQIVTLPVTILVWLVTAERFARFWKRWLRWIIAAAACLAVYGLWMRGWVQSIATVRVPLWLLLTCILAFLGVAVLWSKIRAALVKNSTPKSDLIDGIDWHWAYRGQFIDESQMSAFCPNQNCQCRLEPQRISGFAAIDDIALVCSRCGFTREFDCTWSELRHRVALEIERRFKIGEY